MKMIVNKFSKGLFNLIINLYSLNIFESNNGIFDSYVFLSKIPIFGIVSLIPTNVKLRTQLFYFSTVSEYTKRGTKRIRGYIPNEEKIQISNNVPDWFKQVVCGIMLSDGSIRMNGKLALLSIQQTHQELTQKIWDICYQLKLVLKSIHVIDRPNKNLVYSFQTITLPFFTVLYND